MKCALTWQWPRAGQLFALFFFLSAAAQAQAQSKTRIGVLLPELGRAQSQSLKGLHEELKRLGYVERKNLIVETRNAKGDRSALRPAADELVARKVEAIFTTGTRATMAAVGASTELPIVYSAAALGAAAFLAGAFLAGASAAASSTLGAAASFLGAAFLASAPTATIRSRVSC